MGQGWGLGLGSLPCLQQSSLSTRMAGSLFEPGQRDQRKKEGDAWESRPQSQQI